MWNCKHCGETVDDSFAVCWNCGTDVDGRVNPNFRHADTVEDKIDPSHINWDRFKLADVIHIANGNFAASVIFCSTLFTLLMLFLCFACTLLAADGPPPMIIVYGFLALVGIYDSFYALTNSVLQLEFDNHHKVIKVKKFFGVLDYDFSELEAVEFNHGFSTSVSFGFMLIIRTIYVGPQRLMILIMKDGSLLMVAADPEFEQQLRESILPIWFTLKLRN